MAIDPSIAEPADNNRIGSDLAQYEQMAIRGAMRSAVGWLRRPRLDRNLAFWTPWLALTPGIGLALLAGGLAVGGWPAVPLFILAAVTLPMFAVQLVMALAVSSTCPPPACPECQAPDSPWQPYTEERGLLEHGEELWVAQQPLTFVGMPFGTRCTVIRVGEDLLVHSPMELTPKLRHQVQALGRVRWLLAPNVLHHLYVGQWAEAFPEAELWAAPGLAERRPDLPWTGTLQQGEQAPWASETLKTLVVRGHPFHMEVVLFHAPSKTLVLTDLLENLGHAPETEPMLRAMLGLFGMAGRPTPPTDFKWTIEDPAAMKRCVERMLGWPFERIVVAHGRLVDRGAQEALRRGFAFLD